MGELNRRTLLVMGVAVAGAGLLPPRLLAQTAPAFAEGLEASELIYLTPLLADGGESRCQAEVWFVADGRDAYVVTASDAWRTRAVRKGLSRARVWVGDVGVWTDSDGAYRKLPSMEMTASLVTEPAEHERVLEIFGDKYSLEWLIWGPRFRNGLADGSRAMLRYRPAAA